MNRNYRKGYRYEQKAKEILFKKGFGIVVRSAGSKGLFDLVAINNKEVLLVQIKSGSNAKMDKEERLAFTKLLVPPCVSKEIWYFAFRKEPVIEIMDNLT